MRVLAGAGALIATSQLPMLADDRSAPGSTEAGPGNSPATQDGDKKRGMMQDKPEVFPERGRFERLTICYATEEIGLKKPFSVLHISDTHLQHKLDSLAKCHHVADRRGAGFELVRQLVICGPFEGNGLYHLSPTLIWRQLAKYLFAAVHYSYAHRGVHFVAGEAIEVAAYLLHIDRHVGNRLGTVN